MARQFTPRDRYETVTNQIVAALERGVAPWVRPWNADAGRPRNGHTGHVYQGINTWVCWASGYGDSRWFTFKQVQEYGSSHVRKGEKGTHIVKWVFLEVERKQDDGTMKKERVPRLFTYVVFNYEQIEWDPNHKPKGLPVSDIDPEKSYTEAAVFVRRQNAKIKHGSEKACYSPRHDEIWLPDPSAFKTVEGYWGTSFHELGHWTGHVSRCARDLTGRFGEESYAAEELVAELTAAFLCDEFGLQGNLQHPEYIGSWLRVLKGDKYAVFTAARLAREAMAFMKGEAKDTVDEQTAEPDPNDTGLSQAA